MRFKSWLQITWRWAKEGSAPTKIAAIAVTEATLAKVGFWYKLITALIFGIYY
jgi:hypothetical protein